MKDAPVAVCPECEGPVKRLLYPVGVVFKGSGWYITDSRKPEKTETEAAPKPDAAKTEEPAAPTEKKEATTTEKS